MFDSLKKVIAGLTKKDDVDVYVEIPLGDFKKEEEERRKKEDLGLKIPTRLESFLDLKKEVSEDLGLKIPEKPLQDKDKSILLVELDEAQKKQNEGFQEISFFPETGFEDSFSKVKKEENIESKEILPEKVVEGNHYVINPDQINPLQDLEKPQKKSEKSFFENLVSEFKNPKKEEKIDPSKNLESHVEKKLQDQKKDRLKHFQNPQKKIKENNFGLQSDINFFFKSVAYFFGSICFISLSLYLFYFSEKSLTSTQNVLQNAVSFGKPIGIKSDQNINISLDPNQSKSEIKSNIIQFLQNQEVRFGNLLLLNPEYVQEIQENQKLVTYRNPLRGDEFLFIFFPSASLALRTIAASENKIGVVNIASQNELFISLNVDNAAVAYRELLFYEKFMYDDLKEIFNLRTPIGKVYFKDASINNHILRAIVDEDGVLLVYGFADVRTIVFAPNVAVFEKVYERLR